MLIYTVEKQITLYQMKVVIFGYLPVGSSYIDFYHLQTRPRIRTLLSLNYYAVA